MQLIQIRICIQPYKNKRGIKNAQICMTSSMNVPLESVVSFLILEETIS